MGGRTRRANPQFKQARPAPKPWFSYSTKRTGAIAMLLAAITFAVYAVVLKYPFVNYDDPDYIINNPRIREGLSADTVAWALSSTAQANWHPVTWISHALDIQFFGLDPAGHHFTSILLHAINALLLFLLLRRATGREWSSLFVAALFALHPINVESVAWVAERKTALSMFFLLLTLAAYGWYAQKPRAGRYLLTAVLFVVALAAKPMVVTLPFALLLLDCWPLQRVKNWSPPSAALPVPQRSFRQLILEKLALLALSAASCLVTVVAQRPAMKTMRGFPFRERVANALYSYVLYIGKCFWPARLSVFYSPQGGRLALWQIVLSLVFLAGVTVLVWHGRSRRYPLIGWLWFLGTMVPMLGLIQVGEQGMADRYAYLPSLGIFIMVTWCAADFCFERKIGVRTQFASSIAILLVLSFLTWRQIHTWESSFALWAHSLQVTSENYVAEDFVGTTLMQESYDATGQTCPDEALAHFQKAIAINAEDTLGHLNAGFCEQEHGRLQAALEHYNLGLQSARNKYLKSRAYFNLGAVYDALGDFSRSREYYNGALHLYPNDPQILNGLNAMEKEARIAELSKSVQTQPTAGTYLEIGRLQRETGHFSEARAAYQRALDYDSESLEAHRALQELEKEGH